MNLYVLIPSGVTAQMSHSSRINFHQLISLPP